MAADEDGREACRRRDNASTGTVDCGSRSKESRLARTWFARAVTTWLARNSTALPTDSIILSNSGLESAGRREPKLLHAGRARSIQEAVSQALESKTSWEEDRDGE